MKEEKKQFPQIKSALHPRNKNRERYDFKKLIDGSPELGQFVKLNKFGDQSIDFADPQAVRMLNTAILATQYGIKQWNIPQNYLTPPIPGRADYMHHIADLLARSNKGKIPTGIKIRCLDGGVGASCIYLLIGIVEYDWSFTGTEIDPFALKSAVNIVKANPQLKGRIKLLLQENQKDIFKGVLKKNDRFYVSICNPPFHASAEEAISGTLRKLKNLSGKKAAEAVLNFGGQSNELWCEGGEKKFIKKMITQSRQFPDSCLWYSTLVSKEAHLKSIYKSLQNVKAEKIETLPMGQGNKKSRIVAWTFLNEDDQQKWKKEWGGEV